MVFAPSFEKPENVAPKETTLNIRGKIFNYELSPYSFHTIKIKLLK
jgi:alpha-L-arabinofuranosidase